MGRCMVRAYPKIERGLTGIMRPASRMKDFTFVLCYLKDTIDMRFFYSSDNINELFTKASSISVSRKLVLDIEMDQLKDLY